MENFLVHEKMSSKGGNLKDSELKAGTSAIPVIQETSIPVIQEKSIPVPIQKIRTIKNDWIRISTAIVEIGKLQIRFNGQNKCIDLRTCPQTVDHGYVERATTFIEAILDGFKIEDAISIMKFRDVFTEAFELHEIRKMKSTHMSRAVGRIIGREGKTKQNIENFSCCKFILNDQRVVVMGCSENIKIAKDAIGRLVQGSEPTSIFNRLRLISNKLKDKYGCIQTIYEDLKQ